MSTSGQHCQQWGIVYGKIFEQMYDGTLGTRGPWQALVTFQQMIVLADKEGVLDMTAEALARRTTIPLEIIRIGIAGLEATDPDSRTPDEDGRRIVRLSETRTWGWRIVNHAKYRAIRTAEERREYHRQYKRDQRAAAVDDANGQLVNRSQPIAVGSKQKHEAEGITSKGGISKANRDAGAAAILALWNGMAEEIGYAKVIAVKGKRLAAFNARLVEPGWPENARKAIAYLQGDAWYRSKPDAIRFDVLIRPGKVEEYIERSGVKRGNGNGVAQSRGGARREVDAAFGEQLNDSDAGTRRVGEDDKPVF